MEQMLVNTEKGIVVRIAYLDPMSITPNVFIHRNTKLVNCDINTQEGQSSIIDKKIELISELPQTATQYFFRIFSYQSQLIDDLQHIESTATIEINR